MQVYGRAVLEAHAQVNLIHSRWHRQRQSSLDTLGCCCCCLCITSEWGQLDHSRDKRPWGKDRRLPLKETYRLDLDRHPTHLKKTLGKNTLRNETSQVAKENATVQVRLTGRPQQGSHAKQ